MFKNILKDLNSSISQVPLTKDIIEGCFEVQSFLNFQYHLTITKHVYI